MLEGVTVSGIYYSQSVLITITYVHYFKAVKLLYIKGLPGQNHGVAFSFLM